ncbi:MAG: GNAT family N-acetyltransferase [Lachnospiraceae bacterium]|nr:GNAT family N-acetyltransferase [Lachnospiraceae bacterium]
MNIKLIRATIEDSKELWQMQLESFQSLLDKYQDYDTNPASEPIDKIIYRLKQEETYYYFICMDDAKVGAIRVIDFKSAGNKRISPIFILPQYQNKGIAQIAMQLCEQLHGSENWELDTILQEEGNCYLYEKMGYHRTGKTVAINDKLTLVFYEK